MEVLAEQEIIEAVTSGRPLEAIVDSRAYQISIARYVPAVVTAIHDGHEVPGEIARQMLVTETERRCEEDPFTGRIADSFAISLKILHSRYYYDINRRPQSCIYDDAWGKKVWIQPLSEQQAALIREHHLSYYRVLEALLQVLAKRFAACVLYDLHTYNYSRLDGDPPLFNIGTHFMELSDFQPLVRRLAVDLAAIKIPGVVNRTSFDEVFLGKGYQAEFVRANHPQCLCIPLEIKKVFMDEATCALLPDRFNALRHGLGKTLAGHACWFAEQTQSGSFACSDFLDPGYGWPEAEGNNGGEEGAKRGFFYRNSSR